MKEPLYIFVKNREEEYDLMEILQSKGYTWKSGHSPTDIPTFLQLPKDAKGGMILSVNPAEKIIRLFPAEIFKSERSSWTEHVFDMAIGMSEVRAGMENL